MTQEEINIIVDSVRFSAPVYANRILESLDAFIKDYNAKSKALEELKAKQAETQYQQVEMDTLSQEEKKVVKPIPTKGE